MPSQDGANKFPHLQFVGVERGTARLTGGGAEDPRVTQNKADRPGHSRHLLSRAGALTQYWARVRQARAQQGLPEIKGGIPFLLQVPEEHEDVLAALASRFGVALVAECEVGFILVASDDVDLTAFQQLATDFAQAVHGSGAAAKIIEIYDDGTSRNRLEKILSAPLLEKWPLNERQEWILDVSIQTASTIRLSTAPHLKKKETQAEFQERQAAWEAERNQVYQANDAAQMERERELGKIIEFYQGEILRISSTGEPDGIVELPDSIACRVRMSGLGFNDLIQNNPHIFEVSIPEDIEQPSGQYVPAEAPGPQTVHAPTVDSPTICVIDSGIQEGHRLLAPAIDKASSRCFLPGKQPDDVADQVAPNGHGTCVAGAILYPREITPLTEHQLPFWLQNARLLDENKWLPSSVFPPAALRKIVVHYRQGAKQTWIFNHSIAANGACSRQRMSAWAAEIDFLSYKEDVLIIQATGNIDGSNDKPRALGISQHLQAGRNYPAYLQEDSARISNPSQSLQAITVGSVALADYDDGNRRAVAGPERPSAFTRSGFGMWDSIKPDVVEFGGDYVVDGNQPASLTKVPEVCPELVRSTFAVPGSAFGRLEVGTSFAAPRVTAIAGALSKLLPDKPTLLYRALIIQSARWPAWAENTATGEKAGILRCIGYGVPDIERATSNSESRVTLITDGIQRVHAREAAIFAVEIPDDLRRPGRDFDVRLEVTLSYAAEPRRTRTSRRGYLAVWADWISSNKGESLASFRVRALKEQDGEKRYDGAIPWMLGAKKEMSGQIDGVSRQNGTVQKDWATVKSYELPEHFAIAVRGHPGWNTDPGAEAMFSLAVSIEAVGQNIPVYNMIREKVVVEAEQEARIEV
ncbi:MAG: S8 family peptidase [Verrucomicrobiota bacterium]